MKIRHLLSAFMIAGVLEGCSSNGKAPVPMESGREGPASPAPRFFYDLGASTVDVSGYPQRQQENYKLFLTACGACHAPARALNSPIIEESAWRRFVHRMHLKMEGRGITLEKLDEDHIIEFLVYDSEIRKAMKKEEFQIQQQKLKKLFEEVTLK
ncbi:MAG: hypothetical protein HY400_05640 [Elusimicrobia bacterium]|nr:hypothetical protein [Elusimicrobiota bacterium]